ncbi:MAG TPA: N-acetylmuramoyl-L-alanine amidase [Pseudoxanthomonas sp.]|nr:N-acetylmuramoyl-L-alanine amidase [Pseudoxanthomonas sp.]
MLASHDINRHSMPLARLLLLCALALLLASCAHAPPRNPLAKWVPSPNHNSREAILVVIHATTQDSAEDSLQTLRTANSGGPVSAHYLVGRDGALYQLVADDRRAWHAGPGSWGTISDVNSASIGIELDNNGSDSYPQAQIEKLLLLLDDLCTRLGIPRHQVIAHADMAPTRKTDPGPQFPWARLAQAGFGRWPSAPLETPPAAFDPMTALRLVGYDTTDVAAAIRAFRIHYRGLDIPGDTLDAEDARILHALVKSGQD